MNWALYFICFFTYLFVNSAIYAIQGQNGINLIQNDGMPFWVLGLVTALNVVSMFSSKFWTKRADVTGGFKKILVGCILTYTGLIIMTSIDFYQLFKDRMGLEKGTAIIAKIVMVCTLYGTSYIFMSAIFPIMDNVVMSMLAADASMGKAFIGRVRIGSTLGHSFGSLLTNCLIYLNGVLEIMHKRYVSFLTFGIMSMVAAALIITFIPEKIDPPVGGHGGHHGSSQAEKEKKDKEAGVVGTQQPTATTATAEDEEPESTDSDIMKCIKKPAFLMFLLMVLTAGVVRSVGTAYLNVMTVFYKDVVNNPHYGQPASSDHKDGKKSEGTMNIIRANLIKIGPEILIMLFSKEIMAAIGYHWMLLASLVCGVSRLTLYFFMVDKDFKLLLSALEILKGLSTGLFFGAAVRVANELAPRGVGGNSIQGIGNAFYSGLGNAISGIIPAIYIQLFFEGPEAHKGERDRLSGVARGIHSVFGITAMLSALATATFFVKFAAFDRVIMTCGRRERNEQQGELKPTTNSARTSNALVSRA